jgi:type I restriction enzyme S subunit
LHRARCRCYKSKSKCIGRGVAAIRAKVNSDCSFLEFQVQNVVKNILALTTGSTFPNIDSRSLKNITVAFPPLPEQQAIASALSDVDALITALEQLITKKAQHQTGRHAAAPYRQETPAGV